MTQHIPCLTHTFPLIVFQDDPRVKEILNKTRTVTHKRLQYIYLLAKVKKVCDGGDRLDKKFDTNVVEEEMKVVSVDTGVVLINGFYSTGSWWVWSISA